jgi:hypothetical protein
MISAFHLEVSILPLKPFIPSRFWQPLGESYIVLVGKDITYDVFEEAIRSQYEKDLGGTRLKILEEHLGPLPYWSYPKSNTRIPLNVTILYLADINKSFLVAALRTEKDDFPLVVGMYHAYIDPHGWQLPELPVTRENDSFLVRKALESAVEEGGLTLKSAKIYGTSEEITDKKYHATTFFQFRSFPTTFFVISVQCKF